MKVTFYFASRYGDVFSSFFLFNEVKKIYIVVIDGKKRLVRTVCHSIIFNIEIIEFFWSNMFLVSLTYKTQTATCIVATHLHRYLNWMLTEKQKSLMSLRVCFEKVTESK